MAVAFFFSADGGKVGKPILFGNKKKHVALNVQVIHQNLKKSPNLQMESLGCNEKALQKRKSH